MIKSAMGIIVAVSMCASSLAAQRANTREGFWIGFGLGSGSVGVECTNCTDERKTNVSGYFKLGGTVSPHVLLGFESNVWTNSEFGYDEAVAFGSFVMSWYPSATGAFFLKFGVGAMSYSAEDSQDELTATAASGSFGVGYDIRIARNLSLTPYANAFGSSPAQFKFNGVTAPSGEDIRGNLFQFGLGLNWH